MKVQAKFKMQQITAFLSVIFLLTFVNAHATTFTAVASGDWNVGTTWNQSGATPGSLDNVIIDNGYTVTINSSSESANNIQLATYNIGPGTLTFNGTASLTVGGTLTLGSALGTPSKEFSGNFTMTSGATLTCHDIELGTSSQYNLDLTSGTVIIDGNFTTGNANVSGINNLTINAPGSTVQLEYNVFISGTLTISVGTLELNDNWVFLSGDFINNGNLNEGTGDVIFRGSGSQTISGSTNTDFYDLEIDNSSNVLNASTSFTVDDVFTLYSGTTFNPGTSITVGGSGSIAGNGVINVTKTGANNNLTGQYTLSLTLTDLTIAYIGGGSQEIDAGTYRMLSVINGNNVILGGDIIVLSGISFTNGNIVLGSHNLRLISGATVTSTSSTSFIQITGSGRCIADTVSSTITVPVGDEFAPVTITNGGGATYTIGVIAGVTDNGGTPALSDHAVGLTWDIQVSGPVSDVGLKFQWPGANEMGSFDRALSFVSMRASPTGNWSALRSPSAALGNDPYTQTGTVLSMTNGNTYYFGVGDNISTLPVTLVSFSASYSSNKNEVELNWKTSSEINNNYFSIERSLDGREWIKINQVPGHGNSLVPNNYYTVDNLEGVVPADVIYYRLKQVDFNGVFSYSNIQAVKFDRNDAAPEGYPNPTSGILNLSWINSRGLSNTIQICDMQGRIMYDRQLAGSGLINCQLDLSWLPAGAYFVNIMTGNNRITKFVSKY